MRHSAIHFTTQLQNHTDEKFDAIVCSDFLNVAEFRGLVPKAFRETPIVVYFHENQFAYPSRHHDQRDLHFGFTNFTSCLSADEVWFNSAFNRDSFLSGLETAMKRWPDFPPREEVDSLSEKFHIYPPGVELPTTSQQPQRGKQSRGLLESIAPLKLTWAARWEHDKNPQGLLDALRKLRQLNVDFRLNVLGESFHRVPEPFADIQKEFAGNIDHWGYQDSREQFWDILADSDLFLSTANHEFFGIAVAEAIAAGAIPILPDRLAYPELINIENHPERRTCFLYDGSPGGLAKRIQELTNTENLLQARQQSQILMQELIEKLQWNRRAAEMDQRLATVAQQCRK